MYAKYGKRVLDVLIASIALILLAPFMIMLAIGVKSSSPGPVIFRQTRVGKSGQLFEFYKFRSMPANTASVSSDELGGVEIRRFGRFLRRTNLDELPQLVNILKGDMSLVGPRPPIPSQKELLRLRETCGALNCLPGLTGWAQVNSFDGMSAKTKARFDGEYAASLKFSKDLEILLKTVTYLCKPPPTY